MKKILSLSFLLLIILSCSKDDENSPDDQPIQQDPNAEIADNVVTISKDNSQLISNESELSNGLYKIQFNNTPPEIEVGDIIVGDQDMGYLRKVSSISKDGNTLNMQTTQGSMEDVFGNIEFSINGDLTGLKSNQKTIYEKVNYEYFAEGVSKSDDGFAYNFNDVTLYENDNVNFKIKSGNLTYKPNYFLDFDFSFFSLDRFEFGHDKSQLNANTTFALTLNDGVTIPITEKTLYKKSKTFVKFAGKIPVVITAFLKLKAKVDFTASTSFRFTKKFESNNNITLRAIYENENWNSSTGNIETNFISYPTEFDNQYNSLTQTVTIVPEVIIAIYGINGPLIEPSLAGNFTINAATTSQDWDALINAKSEIQFGISKGILGESIEELPLKSFDIAEKTLWNAPDSLEVISSSNNQLALQGEQLEKPLKVRVWDSTGLIYLKQVPVYFQVIEGGGFVNKERVLTDENGYAEANWTLGNNTESQKVEVSIKKANGSSPEKGKAEFIASSLDNDITGCWKIKSTSTNNTQWCGWQYDYFKLSNNGEVYRTSNNCADNHQGETNNYSFDGYNFKLESSVGNIDRQFTGKYDPQSKNILGTWTLKHTDYVGNVFYCSGNFEMTRN